VLFTVSMNEAMLPMPSLPYLVYASAQISAKATASQQTCTSRRHLSPDNDDLLVVVVLEQAHEMVLPTGRPVSHPSSEQRRGAHLGARHLLEGEMVDGATLHQLLDAIVLQLGHNLDSSACLSAGRCEQARDPTFGTTRRDGSMPSIWPLRSQVSKLCNGLRIRPLSDAYHAMRRSIRSEAITARQQLAPAAMLLMRGSCCVPSAPSSPSSKSHSVTRRGW
jgi:hypothetical protein